MHPHEIKLVRQYAINEIAGGLLIGKHSLASQDPFVRSKLTFQATDEFRHGSLWTEFLDKRGIDTALAKGGNDFFEYMGKQESDIDFLAAVHVYELRVPFQFGAHMDMTSVDPELKELIKFIYDDEKFHLVWIREYLLEKMKTDSTVVLEAIRRAEAVEREAYERYIAHIKTYGEYFGEFVAIVESRLKAFPLPSAGFVHASRT